MVNRDEEDGLDLSALRSEMDRRTARVVGRVAQRVAEARVVTEPVQLRDLVRRRLAVAGVPALLAAAAAILLAIQAERAPDLPARAPSVVMASVGPLPRWVALDQRPSTDELVQLMATRRRPR